MRCYNVKFVRSKSKDISPKGFEVPCGTCYACRTNKINMWIDRIEMEQRCHSTPAYFLTLTYSNENLYYNENRIPSVHLKHVQSFFKLLRKSYSGCRLRYVYLGEYGGKTHRPHYHVILFGLPSADSRFHQDRIESAWKRGHCRLSFLNARRIAYCASFHINVCEWPSGADKPFVQYSRRPGIGYEYAQSLNLGTINPETGETKGISAHSFRYVRLSGEVRPLPPYVRKICFPFPYEMLPLEAPVPLATHLKQHYSDTLHLHDIVQTMNDDYERRLKTKLKNHGKYF